MPFLIILILCSVTFAQPAWEEITPIAGQMVSYINEHITPESGLWSCVWIPQSDSDSTARRPFYSSDGGTTWALRDGGLPQGLGTMDVAVNPRNPHRLLASTHGDGASNLNLGPWLTTDQGRNWVAVRDIHNSNQDCGSVIECGWFADGAHAWYALQSFWSNSSEFYLSADSGQTWTDESVRLSTIFGYFLAHPQIPSIGWFTQEPIMWRTTDFGYTSLPVDSSHHFISFTPGGVGPGVERVYANACYYLTHTTRRHEINVNIISVDTGRTWTFLNPSDTITWDEPRHQIWNILLDPLRPGHLVGQTDDTLFESRDDGQTWTGVIGDTSHYVEQMAYDAERDWFYTSGGLRSGGWTGPFYGGIWRYRRELAVRQDRPQPQSGGLAISFIPNPVPMGSDLTLQINPIYLGLVEMHLYDLLGREVMHWTNLHSASGALHVFMPAGLASGIYFAKVNVGHRAFHQKLFILR